MSRLPVPRIPPLLERTAFGLLLLVIALLLVHADWLWRWDRVAYDLSLKVWSRPPPADVLIVAIDEQSLAELGRWPWSRRQHAALVDRLTRAGAKVIALDIVFAEPDASDSAADVLLAQAIAASGRVVLPVVPEQTRSGGQIIETLPLPKLAEAAGGMGHVDFELDPDGIVRGTFLEAGLGSPFWPALGLAMLMLDDPGARNRLLGHRPSAPAQSSQLWVRDHPMAIPFAGPPGHFARVSYVDALRGSVPPEMFRDKYVLVGTTANGLGEALPTPLSGEAQAMPGVEIHANVLEALRQGLVIRSLDLPWRMVLTVALVMLPALLYPILSPRIALLAAGLMLIAALVTSVILLRTLHLWFGPAPAVLALGLSYPLWAWRRLEQTARSLAQEKERARVTLHAIGNGVIRTDARGVVEYMNPVAEQLTGFTADQARGLPLAGVLVVYDQACRENRASIVGLCLQQCVKARRVDSLPEQGILVSRSGQEYAVRGSAAPMLSQGGGVSGVVLALADMTETRDMAQQMAHQASHDALTGLPNRHLLRDRLSHALPRAQRAAERVAVLLVDLDHFKKVNDSLGPATGDELLQAVAARLRVCLREADTVARLGGDEFVILLEHLPRGQEAAAVAHKVMEALRPPFALQSHEFFVTASLGITLFPRDGDDADTLLRNADVAMYRAKEHGRNNFEFYAAQMNVQVMERLNLETGLRYALERGELLLHYQPTLDLASGQIVGLEALLRWQHSRRGIVSPAEFIPLAEETGLILPIGAWVLETACGQAKAWQEDGLPALRVAVNVSTRQFMQGDLVDLVASTLEASGFEASHLELEITESLLMQDVDSAIVTLGALKAMGVQLAIDDFGTGYSSLSYLKRFPLNRLKIDQSFVRDINTDPDDTAIALAVIAMARSMRLRVTAEGVETAAQATFLRAQGCDEMQGYYFSRPLPADDIAVLLHRQRLSSLDQPSAFA